MKQPPKAKCTVFVTDTHFQPPVNGHLIAPDACHDPDAVSVFLQALKDLPVDQFIHGGDIREMGTLSRWSEIEGNLGRVEGADGKLYELAWRPQMEMVSTFWRQIRKICPKASLHQLEGNHDFRAQLRMNKPPFSQFEHDSFRNQSIWKELGIEMRHYDGGVQTPILKVGKVAFTHGYNAPSDTMRKHHDNVIHGDCHQIAYAPWDKNSVENRAAWAMGCLCKLHPTWSVKGGKPNGWRHGFGIIWTLPDDSFWVETIPINDGVAVMHGKVYRAKPLRQIDRSLKNLELP